MSMQNQPPAELTLYVVATPIGNLDDLSERAKHILSKVALIVAEDTRHTGTLLANFGIKNKMMSLPVHNEAYSSEKIIKKLHEVHSIALVSDAGTPLINDPGYLLVQQALAENVNVIPIPGACAAIAALSVAGLPSHRFCYEGFPARTQAQRLSQFNDLAKEPRTLIFYESKHRVLATLMDMQQAFGATRLAFLAREMTKRFETYQQGGLAELYDFINDDKNQQLGEFVIIVQGVEQHDAEQIDEQANKLLMALLQELPLKKSVQLVAETFAIKKNLVYQQALLLKRSEQD